MASSFTMDPDWERKVLAAAEDGMRKMTADSQRALDAMRPQYEGRPVEEIKPAVVSAWRQANDGTITDLHLSAFAEAIRIGQPIDIRYGGLTD